MKLAVGGRKWNSERQVLPEWYTDAGTDESQDTAGKGWWRRSICVRRTCMRQGIVSPHTHTFIARDVGSIRVGHPLGRPISCAARTLNVV